MREMGSHTEALAELVELQIPAIRKAVSIYHRKADGPAGGP